MTGHGAGSIEPLPTDPAHLFAFALSPGLWEAAEAERDLAETQGRRTQPFYEEARP